jgi:hypothetical protein
MDDGALPISSSADAGVALLAFREYQKLFSWLLLHVARVPTLEGVIVTAWNPSVAAVVKRFASRWPSQSVLLRSDTRLETGRAPRGGYILGGPELEHDARRLLDMGRVLFLLEPASPLEDLYSLTFEPDAAWREWLVEVVGPGFDASDLKRGDVTPHEQVWLDLKDGEPRVTHRSTASDRVDEADRAIRFEKVARLLAVSVGDVPVELQRREETMLLDYPRYVPISNELLALAVRNALPLARTLRAHELANGGITLSMSFVGRDARPVFWDVVWPKLKYPGNGPPRREARDGRH